MLRQSTAQLFPTANHLANRLSTTALIATTLLASGTASAFTTPNPTFVTLPTGPLVGPVIRDTPIVVLKSTLGNRTQYKETYNYCNGSILTVEHFFHLNQPGPITYNSQSIMGSFRQGVTQVGALTKKYPGTQIDYTHTRESQRWVANPVPSLTTPNGPLPPGSINWGITDVYIELDVWVPLVPVNLCAPPPPPKLPAEVTKYFNPTTVAPPNKVILGFDLTNPNNPPPSSQLGPISFTDNLPAGLIGIKVVKNTCGGQVTLPNNGAQVVLVGGAMPPAKDCRIEIEIEVKGGCKNYTNGPANMVDMKLAELKNSATLSATGCITGNGDGEGPKPTTSFSITKKASFENGPYRFDVVCKNEAGVTWSPTPNPVIVPYTAGQNPGPSVEVKGVPVGYACKVREQVDVNSYDTPRVDPLGLEIRGGVTRVEGGYAVDTGPIGASKDPKNLIWTNAKKEAKLPPPAGTPFVVTKLTNATGSFSFNLVCVLPDGSRWAPSPNPFTINATAGQPSSAEFPNLPAKASCTMTELVDPQLWNTPKMTGENTGVVSAPILTTQPAGYQVKFDTDDGKNSWPKRLSVENTNKKLDILGPTKQIQIFKVVQDPDSPTGTFTFTMSCAGQTPQTIQITLNGSSATGPIMNVPLNAQNCLFAEVIPAPSADWCPPHVFLVTGPGAPAYVGSGWSQTVGLPAGPAAIAFVNYKQRAGVCYPLSAPDRARLEPAFRQFAPKSAN
jgi:Domain of unknown function (DUF5979)